ncbi:hypothetical protein Ddye_022857 [Dipteronia dyeriana]|uniref:Reverse transcriptase n=1 Tax=Dipteronia dyeriana TaxID=168575 RepID=A0AAD9TRW0_9ROSI|nr:hypothetical protein Ddye_022857 [Dipteronia dyeriana]
MTFTVEGVRSAVLDMKPTKALRNDGFPALFYQKFWDLVGFSVVSVYLRVLSKGVAVDGMNKDGLGFRNLEISNRALLTNRCWRLLKKSDSLAARILKGCYYKDCGLLEASKSSEASFIWNSLVCGKELLEEVDSTLYALWNRTKLKDIRANWRPVLGGRRDNNGSFFKFILDLSHHLKSKELVLLCVTVWRIGMGIMFGTDYGLAPSLIEINELVVVIWLLDGSHNDSKSGVILNEIANLMTTGSGVAISSISRKANMPAYVLAREALKISGDAFWNEECPLI